MRKIRASALLIGLLGLLAIVVVGCGGSEEQKGSGNADTAEAKQGGEITVLQGSDIQHLDPGESYSQLDYFIQYAMHRPLYSYKAKDLSKPVPDLAASDPVISENQKTLTISLRKGIKFSPPVNREVKADDVKYALERAFTANVQSGYAREYFGDIEGAPGSKLGKYQKISGIQTPDDHTLVIKLTRPTAGTVSQALVMPITMPVPREYAEKLDGKSPSAYEKAVAFTGPYMVENNAEGKITGHSRDRHIKLVRNPNWDRETDYRPAYLDKITIDEGNSDATIAARRVLGGTKLLGSGSPPPNVLRTALKKHPSQIGRFSGGGMARYIPMNTRIKPFDNLNVRRAVIAAIDREALRLTRGGSEVGKIAQHFIPPGIPGHKESGGEDGFKDLDFMRNPKGDMELAKKYMLKAKAEGVPVTADGKYAGSQRFLAVSSNDGADQQTAIQTQAQFAKLGFELDLRPLLKMPMYDKIGQPANNVVVSPNLGWMRDYIDPATVLQPVFHGDSITEKGNVNLSELNDPKINSSIDKATTLPVGKKRNKAWAEINHMVTAQAPAIPWIWDDVFQLASKDVKGVMSNFNGTWDLSFTSLK